MYSTDNFTVWADQAQSGELKEAINLFIWQKGHPQLTLAQAERMAIVIYDMLTEIPKPIDTTDKIE